MPEVLATSVPAGGDLATLAITATACHRVLSPRLTGVPHGTGDLIGALYLAERLQKPPEAALPAAVAVLNRAIAKSAGTGVLQVAAALHGQTAASKQPSP